MTNDPSLRSARICAGVSAALLAAVLFVGGIRSASEKPVRAVPSAAPDDGIAVFAVDRNAVRADEIEQLKSMISDPASSDAVRASAQQRIMRLMEWMELEAAIADVLCARGYDSPVVTVHSDSVNVVVRAETLSRAEAGIILELVTRETGVTGGNVKIIPVN